MYKSEFIEVAKTAGFCYGVKRAVSKTYELSETKTNIATLGALIHNEHVVSELKQKGVKVYENADDIKIGTLVIIRAHGVPKKTVEKLEEKGIEYVDLTCPFVKKIHNIVNHLYSPIQMIPLKKRKKEKYMEMLTLGPSDMVT